MSVVLAHPLTEAAELGVAPAFVALMAAVLAVGAARLLGTAGSAVTATVPPRPTTDSRPPGAPAAAANITPSVARPGWHLVVGRTAGLLLLALAVGAGRLGAPTQADNIVPALVIGLGWPVLLLGTAVLGWVWPLLNPFDTVARLTERLSGATPHESLVPRWALWPVATAGAVGWTWWLAGYVPGNLEPRAIGLALGLYTLVTVAGSLWLGREAWMSQAEVFTVTFRAIADARLPGTAAPGQAASATIGVLIGGLCYAEVRFSDWFIDDVGALGVDPFASEVVLVGFFTAVGLGVASVLGAARWARRYGSSAAVAVVAPWLVVGLGLSAALERDRLWNAAQFLALQASDPFGTGQNLFGTADLRLVAWPYGDVGRLWVQVGVLLVATLTGLALALRRAEGTRNEPAVVLAAGWLTVAVLAAASL